MDVVLAGRKIGDVREAVHIEAHKDLVSGGCVGALSRSRTMWRSSSPRRHETLKQTQLKLVGFVDVYQG
jgi:hypothetical protein